jgi:hypothetical protein
VCPEKRRRKCPLAIASTGLLQGTAIVDHVRDPLPEAKAPTDSHPGGAVPIKSTLAALSSEKSFLFHNRHHHRGHGPGGELT